MALTKAQRNELEALGNKLFGDEVAIKLKDCPPWIAPSGIGRDTLGAVLMSVAGGMSVRRAAREHGTSLLSICRQRLADPEFGIAMDQALLFRRMTLEDKAYELAVEGETETMTKGRGGDQVTLERTTYPANPLLQFLLKAEAPEKYGIDRQEVRAGPLETPPEVIRSEADRKKLLAKLKGLIEQKQAEKTLTTSEFADLL